MPKWNGVQKIGPLNGGSYSTAKHSTAQSCVKLPEHERERVHIFAVELTDELRTHLERHYFNKK